MVDENLLQTPQNIGESALVCQGQAPLSKIGPEGSRQVVQKGILICKANVGQDVRRLGMKKRGLVATKPPTPAEDPHRFYRSGEKQSRLFHREGCMKGQGGFTASILEPHGEGSSWYAERFLGSDKCRMDTSSFVSAV